MNGRVFRVGDSATLKDVLPLVLPEDSDSYEVQKVQVSCTDSGARHDAVVDDDVDLHLEFGRRFFFFQAGRPRC